MINIILYFQAKDDDFATRHFSPSPDPMVEVLSSLIEMYKIGETTITSPSPVMDDDPTHIMPEDLPVGCPFPMYSQLVSIHLTNSSVIPFNTSWYMHWVRY